MPRLSVLLLLLPLAMYAQRDVPGDILRFNPPHLELGVQPLAMLDTVVWLVNDHDAPLSLDGFVGLSGRLTVREAPAILAAGDSAQVQLRLDLEDDLDMADALLAISPQLGGLPALTVDAQPRHADPDWAGAANLWGTSLKNFLQSRVTGHSVFSYTAARQNMFGVYDNVNGQVQCVYTGTWVATTGIPDANIMNCEHTWPQSMGAEGDARSDMHHLYPTLNSPNSIRGNLPFGVVVNQNWSQGGSLRGTDAAGVTVFEPREVHKGDAARALFYFALRYGNLSSFLTYQEPVLRAWALADSVSQKELDRNDAIDALQHNRNPFIDHMGWMSRIASLAGSADPAPTRLLQVAVDSVFLAAATGDTARVSLPLLNRGNQTLLLGYVQSGDAQALSVVSAPASLGAGQLAWIQLAFHPQAAGAQDIDLVFSSNAQNGALRHLTVVGQATDTGLAPTPGQPTDWTLTGAWPNPFNPVTHIALTLARPTQLTLRVHDARGALVLERSDSLPAGASRLGIDLAGRPSGRYWLSVEDGLRAETLPLTLLR